MKNNIFYIHGPNRFLAQRALSQFIVKKSSEGFSPQEVSNPLPLVGFNLFQGSTLYHADLDSSEIKPEALLQWGEGLESDILLICSTKSDKTLTARIPKNQQRIFQNPDTFKASEYAENFFQSEIESLGNNISQPLVKAIIKKCGTDLGFLSFEALKIHHASDNNEISPADLQGVLSGYSEVPLASFLEALQTPTPKEVTRTLSKLQGQMGPSGTVGLCAFISPTILKWLAAADLDSRGVSLTDSANLLGLNAWYYENKILPVSRKWGYEKLLALTDHCSKTHRLALSGCSDPWGYFESGLLSIL